MDVESPPLVNSVHQPWADVIEQLRSWVQRPIQRTWQIGEPTWTSTTALAPESWSEQPYVCLNEKDHGAWEKGQKSRWFGQWVTVANFNSYDCTDLVLRLALTWWAELAEVYVNGELVQVGDLFDHSARILLTNQAQLGEQFWVAIHLVSPGHDPGALVKSVLVYEAARGIDPGFVADELAIVQTFIQDIDETDVQKITESLQELAQLAEKTAIDQHLQRIHQQLQGISQSIKAHQQALTGHAHLDLAWLWPIAETWEVAIKTFASVLKLQTEFPELIFSHSSPALYAWIEQNRPDVFQNIQVKVETGQWEIAAGLWVEPELNLINGESICRQILYGQEYAKEKFGQISRVAWLPDTFGFCQQLPQLLKLGGIEYFVTQKLRWNDTTQFPHDWFWWQAPDGSQVLSYMSAPIGERIEPVKMAEYAQAWSEKTNLKQSLWLPGVGDHGGGPTKDMLEIYRRWQRLDGVSPQLKFSSVVNYLDAIKATSDLETLPLWRDELYLEFHRGCYTSHADQKQANRTCEILLYQAELWSALATLILDAPYPQEHLEQLWKKVLFNQFHDILPGSAIPDVFSDANQAWDEVKTQGTQLLDQAQAAILTAIVSTEPPVPGAYPLVVFNSLNWTRSEVIKVDLGELGNQAWTVQDRQGYPLRCHQDGAEISFWLWDTPGVGYQLVWLCPKPHFSSPATPPLGYVLENGFLQAEIHPQTGEITNLYDKLNQRAVFNAPANQLQLWRDQGQYWDAWNIDPNYADHPLVKPTLLEIKWQAWTDLEQRIRVRWQWRNSTIQQDYCLAVNTPVLRIETQLDWQDPHVLLKAVFPLSFEAPKASYETPCGVTERFTLPNPDNPEMTNHDQAKWEVPALQWADMTEATDQYGVSILNNCKQGYSAQPKQISLTLLRCPTWPDPQADLGQHRFSYGIYPHRQHWTVAKTPHQAWEFNQPLVAKILKPQENADVHPRTLPPQAQLFGWNADNVLLMALKQTQDQSGWLVRVYETHGETTNLEITSDLDWLPEQVNPVNLLEKSESAANVLTSDLSIGAWSLAAWRWNPEKPGEIS